MQIDASIVVDELVHQFADPMAFFRELIQNAVDAGTGEVDVTVSFEAASGGVEQMTVEIRDFGVGMDRGIIEGELLKLFNSGKDRDLTKIGRFGIGFVSVFAVEPDAVCVDTGRAGESWRLLFDADKTYELIERDTPFEGTSVRLFKRIERAEYEAFDERASKVIFEWCKHVDVPVFYNGDEIGAAFDINSSCKVERRTEGTRIVAGYVDRSEAPFGYYHSGLTLMEDVGGPWPYVSFKLDSRYLEHTLTRDQIIEDKNFHKALELLEEIVREDLPRALIDSLERAVKSERVAEAERLARIVVRRPRESTFWERGELLNQQQRAQKKVFPIIKGEPVTTSRLQSLDSVYWARDESPLVKRISRDETVIRSPSGDLRALAELLLERRIFRVDEVFFTVETREPGSGESALVSAVASLLGDTRRDIRVGRVSGAEKARKRAWLGLRADEVVCRVDRLAPGALASARRAELLVLNTGHDLIQRLTHVAEMRPDWAALVLLTLTCPDATADDPGADALLRRAYQMHRGRS